ncbi:MAG: hypothetical protein JSS98_20260 [Bacteroidetes bacterium]|nr:hypothetical protein [Bacteroidota bacterium]
MNTDLKKVLVIDPVVDVEESYQASEVVYKSGVNKSIYKYTADSYSNQNWIWNNITPPSLTTIVKRNLRVAYSMLVVNTWTTADNDELAFNAVDNITGAPSIEGGNNFFGCIPRACPVQSAASAIELRLNGSATSTSINDYVCIYPHLMTEDDMNRFASEMPLQKDNLAIYAPDQGVGPRQAFNDNRNPFSPYGSNTTVPSRASFVWKALTTGTSGTQSYNVYQLDLVEELFVSPMTWAKMMDTCAGLSNLNNLILNIRFADLNRMISSTLGGSNALYVSLEKSMYVPLLAGNVLVNGSTEFQNPTLLVEYITQDPILAARQPATLVYDYSLLQPFISSCGTWSSASRLGNPFTAQSLRLASIPSKLYLFARISKSAINTPTLAQTAPDTFLRLRNIAVNFNNRINLFATYSESDLYNMSVRNGLQDTFADWKYNTGSVCIIDISRDIGLEADEDAGQANKYSTLQITATLDPSPLQYVGQATPISYDFYILVEQPGKAFITASECQYILTGPSSAEVLALTANLNDKVDITELAGKEVGGSVFGKVGKLFKSGLNVVKNVNPQSIAQGVETAQNMLKSVGLGVAGGAVTGGKMKHSRVY